MKKRETEKPIFKVISTIKNIICWVFLVIVIFAVVAVFSSRLSGKTPTIMGYSFFRVSSESMLPELEIGDIILVKECDAEDLSVGDVISYNGKVDDYAGKIITHRVIETALDDEIPYIITKGDANDISDPKVYPDQVIGKMIKELPAFSMVFNFFITPYGLIAIIVIILLAFSGDIVNFVKALTNSGEEEESIDEIIARIQREDAENQKDEKK